MFRNPTTDLIIVLVIVLLIFGPKRLPGLGRSLGEGLREFKDSITGDRPRRGRAPSGPGCPAATHLAASAAPGARSRAGTSRRQPRLLRRAGAPEGSSERRS